MRIETPIGAEVFKDVNLRFMSQIGERFRGHCNYLKRRNKRYITMDIINIIEKEIKVERYRIENQWKGEGDMLSREEKNTSDFLFSLLNIIEMVKKSLLEKDELES